MARFNRYVIKSSVICEKPTLEKSLDVPLGRSVNANDWDYGAAELSSWRQLIIDN